jgi:hypothetical protein
MIPPPAKKITLEIIHLSPRTEYNPSRRASLVGTYDCSIADCCQN